MIDTLRKDIPCSETNAQTRDATFAPTADQFQCSATISEGTTVVLFVNFTSAHTLASAVIYQGLPIKALLAQAEREEGGSLAESEVAALMELHSDILSRIDNARAPPGSYVEYSKNFEQQKFAVKFK